MADHARLSPSVPVLSETVEEAKRLLAEPVRINVKSQTVLNAMKANPNTYVRAWLEDLQAAVSQDAEQVADAGRTLLEALTAAERELTAPNDATGQGRLLLNDYGRRCWDAGYRTVHAEIREEEHEKQRLSTLLSELRSLRDDMQAQAVTHRQRVTIAEAARKHAHADHDAALDCDDWAATLSRLTGDTT